MRNKSKLLSISRYVLPTQRSSTLNTLTRTLCTSLTTRHPVHTKRLSMLAKHMSNLSTSDPFTYPQARRDDSIGDIYPGHVKVSDPYRWLEDPDSDETKAFVADQNLISSKLFSSFEKSEEVRQAVEDVFKFERFTAPAKKHDGFWYWSYNPALLNQSQIWRSKSLDWTKAELFFDPNLLSDDGTVSVGSFSFSDDGKMVAYSVSKAGSDNQTIWVKETSSTDTLNRLADEILYVKFSSIEWTKDNKGFIYQRFPEKDNSGRGNAEDVNAFLAYHEVGTTQDKDIVLHSDPQNPVHKFGGEVSEDGRILLITTSQGTENTNKLSIVRLGDDLAVRSGMKKIVVVDDFHASFNYVTNFGSIFVFETNENAPNNKVVTLNVDDLSQGFKDLIPESKDVLQSVVPFNLTKLILTYSHDVKDEVSIWDGLTGQFEKKLPLPVGLAVGGVTSNIEYTDGFFISVGGFTTPRAIYRYDSATQETKLYRETFVAGFDAEEYETEQVFYTSKDGTRVPMFISGRKGLPKDGTTPLVQYGYGGFEISSTPAYSPLWAVLMKNFNARFAMVNIRGGGEYGQAWWKAAIRDKRQNAYDDFQWASKYLIEQKYTSAEKLSIYGGSNGGLLVAVCLNQAPELYGAAMAAVGVLDMLRFHKFTIGAAWISDFGSPDDPDMFPHIRAYSPLHNISSDKPYPATLLLTADHDDRVSPAHTLKFSAQLQYQKANNIKPLIVRIETDAGHGAGTPTSKQIEQVRDQLAFLSLSLGMKFKS